MRLLRGNHRGPGPEWIGVPSSSAAKAYRRLEKRWEAEHEDDEFVAHDPYVARLMDVFDILGSTYRIART